MQNPLASPSLFSFIRFRKEVQGGLLFNPYLMSEVPLDDFEYAVLEMCTGKIPAGIMGVELARAFRISRADAEQKLEAAFGRLDGQYAIRWRGQNGSAVELPDTERLRERLASAECAASQRNPAYLSAPLSILWEVTHACNLGCVHCLSACGRRHPLELSTEEAKALIEQLAAMDVFWFTLGGGEPLLRPDIYELLRLAAERNLPARLTTNGYAVDDEVIRRLADLKVFSAQISLDGLEPTHDRIRARDGAFRRAVGAIELFVGNGYMALVNFAVNAWNWREVGDVARLAADLGVSSMKVGLVVPLGRGQENGSALAVPHEVIRRLALETRELQEHMKGRMALQLDGLFPFLLDAAPAEPAFDDGCGPGCSAGVAQVVVSYDGSVYACPYLRGSTAGNIRTQTLREIWDNAEYFEPLRRMDRNRLTGKCGECAYRPSLCTGGCRGAAWSAYGDLLAEDPHCWRELQSAD